MRVSLIVPTLWVKPESVIVPMLQSVSGEYDELLIVDGEDKLSEKINYGLNKATGDLLVVSNDDAILIKGSLQGLYKKDSVISPNLSNGYNKIFHAHMWGMDRSVYEKIGGMNEEYVVYWMDTDYAMRLREAGVETSITDEVVIKHEHPATTLGTLGSKYDQEDEQTFIKQWGERIYDPFRP